MTSPADDRLDQRLVAEAAAALPPERDDEPASLRQDILDELGDHLACAFRRELLRTNGDSARAETNVRQCFGNPATVARRLWFDAMKGKLMAQKILIGTCAVVVAACVLFGVLLWRTAVAARQANAALLTQMQDANAALLEQSQQANAALLKQMESLRKTASAPDPQWNPVKIRVVTGSEDGPPAEGVSVHLSPRSNTSGLAANGITDADGIADMGLVQPGAYELSVNTPAKAWFKENLAIRAGRETSKTIVCPPAPASVPIQWAVSWPEELLSHPDRNEMWCVVGIQRDRYQHVSRYDRWMNTEEDQRLFAFHPDGRVIDLLGAESPAWWQHPETRLTLREPLPELPEGTFNLPEPEMPKEAFELRQAFRNVHSGIDRLQHNIREARQERDDLEHVPAGARYHVVFVALARWDGTGLPLSMLEGVKSAIFYENGWLGLLEITSAPQNAAGRASPSVEVPLQARVRPITWTIPVPTELLNEDAQWETPTVFGETRISLRPQPPVEAPRPKPPAETTPYLMVSIPVRVECVAGSKSGSPLADVVVQLDRAGFPNDLWSAFNLKTNEIGSVLFQMPPGSYHNHLTMPWGEHSHADNVFEVAARQSQPGSGTRVETFVCPSAPPPTEPVTFDVHWPAVAKQRNDLWLVLELSGESKRAVGGRNWTDHDWHLVAIHPDGRVVGWRKAPAVRHVSWHRREGLPAMLSKLVPDDSPPEVFPTGKYRPLGVGIARWDGNGDPSQLLKGLRDGRYLSRPRGAFFYVLRTLVPMKAAETLPATPVQHDGQRAIVRFDVPEPFLGSALARWNNVPHVESK